MTTEHKDPWVELAKGVADRPDLAALVESMRAEYVDMLAAVVRTFHPDAMDFVRAMVEPTAEAGGAPRPSAYARLLSEMVGGDNSVGADHDRCRRTYCHEELQRVMPCRKTVGHGYACGSADEAAVC